MAFVCRTWGDRLTVAEIRKSKLLQSIIELECEPDINKVPRSVTIIVIIITLSHLYHFHVVIVIIMFIVIIIIIIPIDIPWMHAQPSSIQCFHHFSTTQILDFWSYEHYYVIYVKFWDLDTDHDLIITRDQLAQYDNRGSCRWM